jgi:hypothetical protein
MQRGFFMSGFMSDGIADRRTPMNLTALANGILSARRV